MKKIITNDNSITFYNEEIKDYYHSKSGAREEAIEKHAKALGIQYAKNPIIFDMFFGIGYNAAAAIDLIKQGCTIFCFENDKNILRKILDIDADFKNYPIIKRFVKNFLISGKKEHIHDNKRLVMVFGDALIRIKETRKKADFVFFDPFSPNKVPEHWSESFIKDIYDNMNHNSKLSTYSFSKIIRDRFEKAGFNVQKGPKVGRYTPSLIAIKGKP